MNKIGKNNYISPKVIIYDNVMIGDNNKIYDGTIIYPNTIIGNGNIIYNNNTIGEIPVQSDGTFTDHNYNKTGGVIIGDNNFFHVNNIIFAGTQKQTVLQNNNKILGGVYIHHDCQIHNNTCIYPRASLSGYVRMLNNSSIGSCAFIHQNIVVGQYSMIGGNSTITKHVIPYFININNKITRPNYIKLSEEIKQHEKILIKFAEKYKKNESLLFDDNIPKKLIDDVKLFLSYIKNES